jgi:hypothetical protein
MGLALDSDGNMSAWIKSSRAGAFGMVAHNRLGMFEVRELNVWTFCTSGSLQCRDRGVSDEGYQALDEMRLRVSGRAGEA